MKIMTTLLMLITIQSVSAAPYYRFWRGQKLPQLTEKTYMDKMMKDFIPQAPKLFPHLTSYLVAIPPKEIGVDEVALLAYTNEEDYIRGRATAEGTAYSNAHWELFERENSKSLVPKLLDGKIEANQAYDLINKDVDWSKGTTFFYMGKKKTHLTTAEYLKQLDSHVKKVSKGFRPMGMKGYVILITEDMEYAWINWNSEESAKKGYASPFGINVMNEAAGLMDIIQWSQTSKFNKKLLRSDAYHVTTQKQQPKL